MVWDPTHVTPRPWVSVVAFYRALEERNADFQSMRLFAEHLSTHAHAGGRFGATSGTALFVAWRPDADWLHEGVRIDVELSGAIAFVRLSTGPPPRNGGVQRADAASMVRTFERLWSGIRA